MSKIKLAIMNVGLVVLVGVCLYGAHRIFTDGMRLRIEQQNLFQQVRANQ